MIASAAFVIGFLVIGLTVLLTAMRGGPRGAREAMHSQTRSGNRVAIWAVSLVAVVLGVGVPALVMAGSNNGQKERAPGGVKLTANEEHGRKLFAKNCNTCHTLHASNGVGKVGPNLDALISGINGDSPASTFKQRVSFVKDAIAKGRANGRGQMPAELLDGQDATDAAEFVAKVAGR